MLGIPDTKVSQAVFAKGAAFDKVARLMLANPLWTIVDLLVHMVRVSDKEPGLSKPGELADVSPRPGVRPNAPAGAGVADLPRRSCGT